MSTDRFQVASYSDGLWCIVDTTKFLDDEQRLNNWPMQVQDVSPFSDRDKAERFAKEMNSNAEGK